MSALKENQCYGLSSGKLSRGGNISVFHVKLTDSAARAIGSFQHGKVGSPLASELTPEPSGHGPFCPPPKNPTRGPLLKTKREVGLGGETRKAGS